MKQIPDISHWTSLDWFNTGGTRAKKYLHNPDDNKTYYFKKSIDKFPFEFWSEIIASGLGEKLELDVLKYDVAIFEGEIGCVSQSMIDPDKEELIEGGKYLQAFDNTFSPDDKKLRNQYTFQLIENSLQAFKLDHVDKIIELIIFDAIIGNGDRHQENWAFIGNYTTFSKSIDDIEYVINSPEILKFPKWLQKILAMGVEKKSNKNVLIPEVNTIKLRFRKNIRFAPIYDNGSSLCRECTPDKIESMLKNKGELDAYLKKGLAEIHWEQEKISHFDLINRILDTSFNEQTRLIIKKVVKNYNETDLVAIMADIDAGLPEAHFAVKIPQNRKEIITKLVSLRAQKLSDLIK